MAVIKYKDEHGNTHTMPLIVPMDSALSSTSTNGVQNKVVKAAIDNAIAGLAEATPVIVNSTSGMTDNSKIYVLTTDQHIYYHNGSEWVDSGMEYTGATVVQETGDSTTNVMSQKAVTDELDGLKEDLVQCFHISKNLIDPSKMTDGYISDTVGSIDANTQYNTTDYIPIRKGQSITVSPRARVVIAYNLEKNPIASTYDASSTVDSGNPYTFAASMDGFVRFTVYRYQSSTWQAENGEVATDYEPFGEIRLAENVEASERIKEKMIAEIGDAIEPIQAGIDDLTDAVDGFASVCSINLLDNLAIEYGDLDISTGAVVSSDTIKVSPFIPCDSEMAYSYTAFSDSNVPTAGYFRKVVFYNAEKEFISGRTSVSGVGGEREFITASSAKYFRLTGFIEGTKWMIVKSTLFKGWALQAQQREIENPNYIPYGYRQITNNLTGKYLIDFGDSIQRGDGTNGKGIGYLIAKRNKMAFTQFSVGGETVAESTAKNITYDKLYQAGKNYYNSKGVLLIEGTDYTVGTPISSGVQQDNVLSRYIDTAFSRSIKPDYIIIEGGTNDILKGVPIGEITTGYNDSFDDTTFAGALEKAICRLRNQWPDAKILYIRVHNMNSRNAEMQKIYGETALSVCKKWSIKVCDIYSDGGLNTNISLMRTSFTANEDGTHPNELGYEKFYVNPVEQALLSI